MSPYDNIPKDEWKSITSALVDEHPITNSIAHLCLLTWESILNGTINSFLNLKIREMSISPQAISNLFHDILPIYIERTIPNWKKGIEVYDKDVVNVHDNRYSFEIKVSSSKNSIFGNRSYGQSSRTSKKSKDGYYLAINVDKLSVEHPSIRIIRFGWLDHTDWISQRAQTGQQARLGQGIMHLNSKHSMKMARS